MDPQLAEFLEMVRRNLGAKAVRLLEEEHGDPPPEATLLSELPSGQMIAVFFESPEGDRESARRRLEMLIRAFSSVLISADERGSESRLQKEKALYEQLASL